MNPETKSANARLQRIKIVSRIARGVILCFLVFAGWMLLCLLPYANFANFAAVESTRRWVGYGLATLVYHVVICYWYWK